MPKRIRYLAPKDSKEGQSLRTGATVKLRGYDGKELTRVIADASSRTILVCTREEFERAKKEGRPPQALGWPPEDVITVEDAGQDDSVASNGA